MLVFRITLETHAHGQDCHRLFRQTIFCLLKIFVLFGLTQIRGCRVKSLCLRSAQHKLYQKLRSSYRALQVYGAEEASNLQLESRECQRYPRLWSLFESMCSLTCPLQFRILLWCQLLIQFLILPKCPQVHPISPEQALLAWCPYNLSFLFLGVAESQHKGCCLLETRRCNNGFV